MRKRIRTTGDCAPPHKGRTLYIKKKKPERVEVQQTRVAESLTITIHAETTVDGIMTVLLWLISGYRRRRVNTRAGLEDLCTLKTEA